MDASSFRTGSSRSVPASRALRIGAIYLAVSVLWIVFSDSILFELPVSSESRRTLQTGKGLIFVAFSSLLVTGLAWRELARTRELERSDARYHDLFSATPLPMWVFDRETLRFLEVNDAAVARYGWSREEFVQMTLRDIRPREDVGELEASVGETPQEGFHEAGIFRHLTRSGEIILAQITSHRIEVEGRDAELVVAEDVTDRLEVEAQLRQAQRMESVGRLAGGVAHDFNNLLTVIGNLAALAREESEPGSLHAETYRKIQAAQQRGAALTRQLLTFSREVPGPAASTDATATLARMGEMLPPLLGERVEVELIVPDTPLSVPLQAVHLEQVVMNLAVNARDAMPEDGRLRIELERVGDGAVLRVTDTGSGMTEEVKRQIFEPFYTTKERGRGTGLGLSTTYGLVTGAGGEIAVESAPGRGTTFTIRLPVAREVAPPSSGHDPAAHPAAAEEQSPERPEEAPIVLVVEDEPALRTIMQKGLKRRGYQVLTASSGPEALRLLEDREKPVHLVITDMVMPEMDGTEFLRHLSRSHPDLPTLLVSGYSGNGAIAAGQLPAEQHFLAKPFALQELTRAVAVALGR
jgi:hypothetical protein